MQTACAMENDYTLAEYNYFNAVSLKTLVDEHNVQLRNFAPEILAELRRVSEEVMNEMATKDAFTQKVHQSFSEALELQRKWTGIADQAFLNARDPQN